MTTTNDTTTSTTTSAAGTTGSINEGAHVSAEHEQHEQGGTVLEFTKTRPADVRPADDRPADPPPAVVDGTVVSDDGAELDAEGEARVPVDPPGRVVRELLPWQRAEIARRPIVAPWLTRAEDVKAAARWAAGWAWHATGFHVVRAPLYAGRLTLWAPRGAWLTLASAGRWVSDAESAPLLTGAVRAGESDQYLRLAAARADRVRARRRLVAGALAGIAAGGAVLAAVGEYAPPGTLPAVPGWLVAVLVAAGVLWLGKVGIPADRPVTGRSVVRTEAQRLTSDVVVRALAALGISEINKAMGKGGPGVTFPAPITRDGPGWRADVDLPYGVTAADIMDRREGLASGLRRPLGCVWPEPSSEEHAGRLVLWVGDQDMARSKPVAWPLARGGAADLFRPIPFGVDQRGRPVTLSLVFESMVIGSKPRMGKTFAMRVVILAAALDAGVQLRVFELKGTGDLSTVEGCCHHYGSGADTATLEACMESLRDLYTELDKRAATIRKLPREICPENKVTPELARRRELGLYLVVTGIDECQELFSHPDFKDEAARLAEAIIKRGPALGIILVLATQRPDAKSMPTGVSANVGIRFCLRVMGQLENDMVLGTSAYKGGLRATSFGPRDKGIGYLVGAADDPQIVRTAYIDGPAAEVIAVRARALRERAGTITGHAAGEAPDPAEARRSILADVAGVFGPDEDRLWSEVIAARLVEQHPTTYRGTTPASLAASLKPYRLAPTQVWGTDESGEGRNRRGYLRDAVTTAWLNTRTDGSPGTPGGDGA